MAADTGKFDPDSTPASEARARGRREVLATALAAGGAALTTLLGWNAKEVRAQEQAAPAPSPPGAGARDSFLGDGILERMRTDLQRALKKPLEQRRWVMVIDLQKCIGCNACTVACVAENNLPPGVVYRPVMREEIGEFPNVRRRFMPRPCMQCDNPPCVPPCPVGATYQRPDGIVVIDYGQCIGCRYCITACPYGARYFDFGAYFEDGTPEIMRYETRPSPEYLENRTRLPDRPTRSPKGNARKCQFCLHRTANGMLPACVTTCLGGATYFGDRNDPDSLVHELIGSPRVMRLKEEMGTQPKVYYLT